MISYQEYNHILSYQEYAHSLSNSDYRYRYKYQYRYRYREGDIDKNMHIHRVTMYVCMYIYIYVYIHVYKCAHTYKRQEASPTYIQFMIKVLHFQFCLLQYCLNFHLHYGLKTIGYYTTSSATPQHLKTSSTFLSNNLNSNDKKNYFQCQE